MTSTIIKKCEYCSKDFNAIIANIKHNSSHERFCSRNCAYKGRRRVPAVKQALIPKICEFCKNEFHAKLNLCLVSEKHGKYCSRSCANKGRKQLTREELFYKNTIMPEDKNECWIYKKTYPGKYGAITINGKTSAAHRYSYKLHIGDIPDGLVIAHKCDNKSCVNPAHLFAATVRENVLDMLKKQRNNPRKGADNPWVKLNDEKVRDIKLKLKDGATMRSLSEKYGVSVSSIQQIKENRRWKHVVI